jgi:peptide/nickel transport system substrate-binding protein
MPARNSLPINPASASSAGRRRIRSSAAAAAIALIAVALTACGGSSKSSSGPSPAAAGSTAASGKTLASANVALAAQVVGTSLNPFLGRDIELQASLFDGLTQIDPSGSFSSDLAASWTANADNTQWTFTLRPNLKFWDGTPVTPDDIAWNYMTTKANPTFVNYIYLKSMTSAVAVGTNQVQFNFSAPYLEWPRETSLVKIISKASYEKLGAAGSDSKPMGTGAYEIVSWDGANTLHVKANPDYFEGKPPIENITVSAITDQTTRLNGVQSGTLDAGLISADQMQIASSNKALTIKSVPSNRVVYLGYNEADSTLANPLLREAIGYAVDVPAIIKSLLNGGAKPVGQLVGPAVNGYDASIKPTPYDVAKATALVKQSGYDGSPILFEYPTAGISPAPVEVAQAIAQYMQKIGLKVTLQGDAPAAYSTKWFGKQLTGMFMFSFNPSIMDAGLIADFAYGPSGPEYFQDPQLLGLTAQSHSATDATARKKIFTQMWTLSNQKAFYTPLYNDTYNFATHGKVTVTPRSDGFIVLQELKPA